MAYELIATNESGYRIYFTIKDEVIVLLLCGGNKSNKKQQQQDIVRAGEILTDLEAEEEK